MMKKVIVLIYLIGLLILSIPTTASYTRPPEAPQAPKTTFQLINEYSLKYGVSASVIRKVIACESGYNPRAVGDHSKSFGLVQIHLPSHPSVSKDQALDPEFSVDFLAEKLSKGKGSMWTCFRKWYN